MKTAQLSAQIRGKENLRILREQGIVPGIVYGRNTASLRIKFPRKALEKIMAGGRNTMIEVELGDRTETVMVRELQRHPVKGEIEHVDFYRISLQETMELEVPIVLIGEAAGVKEGGILTPGLRLLTVECLPTQVPTKIEADVSGLEIGDKLTVADLKIPAEVKLLTETDEVVATVSAARVVVEEVAPPAAEPEQEEASVEAGEEKLAAK